MDEIANIGLEYKFFFEFMKIVGLLLTLFFVTNSLILLCDALSIETEMGSEDNHNFFNLSPLQPHFPSYKLYFVSIVGWGTMLISLLLVKVIWGERIKREYKQ